MIKFWKTLTCTAIAALGLAGAAQAQPKVVISQLYAAGGNGGAMFNRDYVELFNAGDASQDLTGWSLQYGSATGSGGIGAGTNQFQALSGVIPAGGYLLVGGQGNVANGVVLPVTPDVNDASLTTGLALGASGGKVALVSSITPLNVTNPFNPGPPSATLVDFVGYGTANAFEGAAAAPAPSTTNAIFRANNGCTDTGSNAADFSAAAAAPRNSATPASPCTANLGPTGAVAVDQPAVCPGVSVTFTVTVTPGTPAVAIDTVKGDFSLVGGGASEDFTNTPPASNTWTKTIAIPTSTTSGSKSIPVLITETGPTPRVGNASGSVTINNCTLGISGTNVSPAAVCSGSQITFNVTVRKNTIMGQGPSTGIVVALDLTNVNAFVPLQQNMTDLGDDPNNADRRLFTLVHTVPAGQLSGSGSVPITVTDAQNNLFNGTGAAPFPFNVTLIGPCTPSTSTVVISQVYGGGGNQGAPYQRDYVELFNRSSSPVDISGWSLQYAGATAAFDAAFAIPAGTIIQPGNYFLIGAALGSSCAGSTPCGDPLPVAVDADGTTLGSLGSQQGKVILLSGVSAPLGMGSDVCPVPVSGGAVIQDFIGYGGANCREGITNAPGLSNTTAAFRHGNGCQDNDQSAADFAAAAPAPRNSASPANPCVATACCQNDGSCVVTAPGGTCNGTLQVGQSTCPPVPACPQPTVCCRAAVCTVELPADCVATGGGVVGVGNTCGVNTCGAPANDHCCRGTTCNPVASGTCTGVIAGSNSIVVTSCGAGNTFATCCYADFNHDGVQSIDDLFLYFNAYFTSNPLADFGGDGTSQPTIDDLFLYINAYFGTCS